MSRVREPVRLSRRRVLQAAGAAALALPGLTACGGSGGDVRVGRAGGDPWKRYAGTTLDFISENTAPTLAIAANLGEFEQLTGIKVRITQLELSALVQKVALDFASGLGNYELVYADPYQILAPYHGALAPLNEFQDDEDLPTVEAMDDFIPTQLRAAGTFEDPDTIYALPYDAPTLIWMYRRDLFDKHGERMAQDLGFDPMPSLDSTWQQYLETARWFGKHAKEDVGYGTLHMAKQHDSLMNDFSNVLWAYGGDYFEDGETVGSLGKTDPGESQLTSDKALEAAEFYQRLLAVADPSSLGWDWTGASEGFVAGRAAMAPLWHEDAATVQGSRLKGKVGFAPLPQGPARRADMYGGCGIGINATSSKDAQRAAWLFVVWATSKENQLKNLKSDVGGGTPTRASVYEVPEVVQARRPPSKIPNILTYGAIEEAWKPGTIGLRPKIPAWNECDTRIFTALSKMLLLRRRPGDLHAPGQAGHGRGDRQHEGAVVMPRRLTFNGGMLAPALILLALLSLFPFVSIVVMSLSRVGLLGGIDLSWAGVDNWTRLFGDGAVGASWLRSGVYFVMTVGLELLLGIGIALLLHATRRGRGLSLSLILMPMFMAPVIVGLLGRFMTDSTYGLYAWVLREAGIYSGDILGTPTAAFAAVTLMDVWQWTPLIALIVLAGLSSVPQPMLEAAALDGAGYWKRLRHIVLPSITGVIIVALLIRSMDAIRYFDIITNTTNGGPADATKTVPVRLYETGFRFFDLGYAAAIGLSMLAVSILLANLFLRLLRRQGVGM